MLSSEYFSSLETLKELKEERREEEVIRRRKTIGTENKEYYEEEKRKRNWHGDVINESDEQPSLRHRLSRSLSLMVGIGRQQDSEEDTPPAGPPYGPGYPYLTESEYIELGRVLTTVEVGSLLKEEMTEGNLNSESRSIEKRNEVCFINIKLHFALFRKIIQNFSLMPFLF
jgi:hypothetical protein